jgi:Uma2 family endonuclease
LIEIGVLTEDDNLELLEGYLVHKMSRNPPHDSTLTRLSKRFFQIISDARQVRIQMAITLSSSEPEPDLVIARGTESSFDHHHPVPEEIDLVVEVSDSTLDSDRVDKQRIYARASLPIYWIVNLIDRQIEVYTQPSGNVAHPTYTHQQIYRVGDSIPVILNGTNIAQIVVQELLP